MTFNYADFMERQSKPAALVALLISLAASFGILPGFVAIFFTAAAAFLVAAMMYSETSSETLDDDDNEEESSWDEDIFPSYDPY